MQLLDIENDFRNQTTIISLEWLNTKRMYFRTNSSPVYSDAKLPALVNTLLVIPSRTEHCTSLQKR